MTEIPEDLFGRAVTAWTRHCERTGQTYQQPSEGDSEVVGSTVTLANMHGTLARYRWAGTRLVRLGEE